MNPAPGDPFELPELTKTDHVRPDAISELQRRTVEGHVIAVWGKVSLLLSDRHGQILRVELKSGAAQPCLGDRVKVVGEAIDGEDAVSAVGKLHPDVVIMDLMMPVMDGVTATERIVRENPDTKVVILTTYTSSDDLSRAEAATIALRKHLLKI